jgi:hypothetical protein
MEEYNFLLACLQKASEEVWGGLATRSLQQQQVNNQSKDGICSSCSNNHENHGDDLRCSHIWNQPERR